MDRNELDSAKAFLGVGWPFPIQPDNSGAVAMVAYEEDIRQAVYLILETEPGERVMRPDFGAGLRSLAFEPLNAATMSLARHRTDRALITWEPRIDNISVQVSPDPPRSRLLIEIGYRVRATNTFYNLVYPFYLQEAHP